MSSIPASGRSAGSGVWPIVLAACVMGLVLGVLSVLVNPLYLLAAAPVLAIGAWALRDAKRGLLLLILALALLPRIASPVSIGFKPTVLDGAIVLTLAASLLWQTGPRPGMHSAISWPLIGLITVTVTTFLLGTPNGAVTTLVLRRFAELLFTLLFVFVLIGLLRRASMAEFAVRATLVLGGVSAAIALALYVMPDTLAIQLLSALRPFGYPSGPEVLRFIRDDPALMQRATGLWIDPNAFGGYLLMVGALGLPQLFAPTPLLPRRVLWLCVGSIALALVLTVSRGAMLGLALAGVMVGVLWHRRLLGLGALALVGALLLPQTQQLIGHFLEGFAGQDLSTQMRFGEYKDAFRLIERYPLLGVGFVGTPDNDLYVGVSSMYLLILSQMGLLGLGAFAATMIAFIGSGIRAYSANRLNPAWRASAGAGIAMGAYASVSAALFTGVFDHYFFNFDFHNSVTLFWFMVALGIAALPRADHLGGMRSAPSSRITSPLR